MMSCVSVSLLRAVPLVIAGLLCLLVHPPPICADVIIMDSNATLGHYICDGGGIQSNTTILLNPGVYILDEGPMCRIEDITDLTIRGTGDPEDPTMIICQESSGTQRGIAFTNVTNLRIDNVRIENCGTEVPLDLPEPTYDTFTYFGTGQKASLVFSHCMNLWITGVTISRSFGMAMVGINVIGVVKLHQVTVQNTDNSQHIFCAEAVDDLSCSGAGISFVYSDNNYTTALGENTTLTVSDSLFLNNTNRAPAAIFLQLYLSVRAGFRSDPIVLTGASGIAIYSSQKDYFLDIRVTDTTVDNCGGDVGGVLLFNYNTVLRTFYLIENSTFIHNRIDGPYRGGAILLGSVLYLDHLGQFPSFPDTVYTMMVVRGSLFDGNVAEQGGGMYWHITPQNISELLISVENTTFTKNAAVFGSAFGASTVTTTFSTKQTTVLLEDITGIGNTLPNSAGTTAESFSNSGVFVFINIHNVTVMGKSEHVSRFSENTPGAFVLVGGDLLLSGHVSFEDNFGFSGGALTLLDQAKLFIHEGSNLYFARNQALQLGGAIYGEWLGTGLADVCMIQIVGPSLIYSPNDVDALNLNLTFVNNTAGEAGNSFYCNPIYNCIYLPESSIQHSGVFNEKQIYDAIFNFEETVDNGVRELNSIPHRMCYCGDEVEYSEDLCANETQFIMSADTVPGKHFTINLIPVDAVGTPVASLLYAEIEPHNRDDSLSFGPAQGTRRLRGVKCTEVQFAMFGAEGTTASIYLYARLGGFPLTVNMTINPCPHGFHLEPSSIGLLHCACDDFIINDIDTTCNDTTYTIDRPDNTWIGLYKDDVVYVSTCPINYCDEYLDDVDLTVEDQLCENGRSGLLCGECDDSLSVIFGSAECKECSNLWLLSIPLYMIAGIFLVLILFVLNLTVRKGTVIVLIFYVNIISVNTNIFFRGTRQGFLFIFISLLNLELGFPMCFYDGMSEIAKTGFQFVFPTYLLILCGVIIYLSRWSSKMQKITASSGVAVLATLIYLSYNKILRTVIDILSSATLHTPNSNHQIWLYDANEHYFEGLHAFLGIVAVFVILVLIVPYTSTLLFIVLLQRKVRYMLKIKPLIDVYLASFKDKWRYWFGLRLLVLTVMCVLYAALGTDDPSLSLMFQAYVIVGFAVLQAYVMPYRSLAIELLDMSFIMNFIILTLATSYITEDESKDDEQVAVVNLMLGLAFIAFIGIITYHTLITLRKIDSFREKMDKVLAMIIGKMRLGKYAPETVKSKIPPPADVTSVKPEQKVSSMELGEMIDMRESTGQITGTTTGGETSNTGCSTDTIPGVTNVKFRTSEGQAMPEGHRPHAVTFSKLRESLLDYM